MTRKKKTINRHPIECSEHKDKERANNPPLGQVTPETDPDTGQKRKAYSYDPHLAPQVERTLGQEISDPACGSGGLLVRFCLWHRRSGRPQQHLPQRPLPQPQGRLDLGKRAVQHEGVGGDRLREAKF